MRSLARSFVRVFRIAVVVGFFRCLSLLRMWNAHIHAHIELCTLCIKKNVFISSDSIAWLVRHSSMNSTAVGSIGIVTFHFFFNFAAIFCFFFLFSSSRVIVVVVISFAFLIYGWYMCICMICDICIYDWYAYDLFWINNDNNRNTESVWWVMKRNWIMENNYTQNQFEGVICYFTPRIDVRG